MIVEKFKYTIWITTVILILGLVFGFVYGGLNIGLDFTGGSVTTIELGQQYNTEDVTNMLKNIGIEKTQVVKTGDNWTQAQIKMQLSQAEEESQADVSSSILIELQKSYPNAAILSQDKVGGVASSELVFNAFMAVLIACGLMLLYIWIRFELYQGVGAVVALAHDVAIMAAFMCFFRVEVNSTFIAACLTIVGYSINDTIVLFDRIRDNNKVMGLKKYTREQIANTSFMQTLGRTINTALTTLLMVIFLYIFGVESIKIFAFPLIVGIVTGVYSSMFIAVPIATIMQNRHDRKLLKGGGNAKPKAVKAAK
jgi:preprotein translocase subunit SecF